MTIQIIDKDIIDGNLYLTLSSGNKEAFIGFTDHFITVCLKNTAHRTFRGAGRTFRDTEEAIEAYKSPIMKSLIRSALAIRQEQPKAA